MFEVLGRKINLICRSTDLTKPPIVAYQKASWSLMIEVFLWNWTVVNDCPDRNADSMKSDNRRRRNMFLCTFDESIFEESATLLFSQPLLLL
jgi:hypothetical protein